MVIVTIAECGMGAVADYCNMVMSSEPNFATIAWTTVIKLTLEATSQLKSAVRRIAGEDAPCSGFVSRNATIIEVHLLVQLRPPNCVALVVLASNHPCLVIRPCP